MPHSLVGGGQGLFLGAVSSDGAEAWHATVQVGDMKVNFRLDTGADVTVVPQTCVPKNTKLQKSTVNLYGPGQSALTVKGKFTTVMKYKEVTATQEVYVVDKLQKPLLGRPALEALQLVQRVQAVKTEHSTDYKSTHPKLWKDWVACQRSTRSG
jgi:predicted aspartyl protease